MLMLTDLNHGKELTLNITEGNTTTFSFNFCSVAPCPDATYAQQLMTADRYMCLSATYQHCPTWVCRRWDEVWLNTGVNGYTYKQSSPEWRGLQDSVTLIQDRSSVPCSRDCNPLYLTVRHVTQLMSGTYGLRADVTGKDPIGRFKIQMTKANATVPVTVMPKRKILFSRDPNEVIAIESGFRDTNKWIDWMVYIAFTLGA